jgi:Dehydroquinase class II
MAKTVFVLNGSNLNMLGKREPHLYGHTTLAEIEARTKALAEELDLECEFRQTNSEAVLIRMDPGSVREGCRVDHQSRRFFIRLDSSARCGEADPQTCGRGSHHQHPSAKRAVSKVAGSRWPRLG